MLPTDRAFERVVSHVYESESRLAVFVQSSEHFLQKLFLFLDKVIQIVTIEYQSCSEQRIGQTPGSFRHKSRMAGYGREVRFDRRPESLVLFSELDVVVKDLLLLFRREIMNVNHDLALPEKRKGPSLRSFLARL